MYTCQCCSTSALGGYSPRALTFGRDMHLNIPIVVDILTLKTLRQAKIDQALLHENRNRKTHEYKVGDQVYLHNKNESKDKLKPVFSGPYQIIQVHTNNTVTIRHSNNIIERITIRRLKPAK